MMPHRTALLAAMAMLAAAPTCAQGGSGISLSITSPEDSTPFTATCTIVEPDGERTETWQRVTPVELTFEAARGLGCRIESAGTLEIVATGPGVNVSRTYTTGGTITIDLGG
jgi:hypothetical protein